MKILFVGEALSGFGGTETVIQKLTQFIENDENEQHQYMLYFLCRSHKVDKTWLMGKNTKFIYAKLNISFLRKIQFIRSLANYIKEYQPDVIISFDITTCELASKAITKSKLSIPLVSWVHYSLEHKKHPECVLFADYHLAISTGIKEQLVQRNVPTEKIFTIYNPVSKQMDVIARPDDSIPKSFIYVGRLKFEGQKRLKDMFDAFSNIDGNWILHIVGSGSDVEICQRYTEQLGIADRVKWHGWQQKPWGYIEANIGLVSAFIMTSKFEGLPMTLLEAMSYGIYCISSDCPSGPADIIQNDINGKLYPIGRLDVLQVALSEIVHGKKLPAAEQIKTSIAVFYDDEYYQNMKRSLINIIHSH